MNEDTALIIMAKQPIVGSTKTRLTPYLTPVEAAQLYEALLRDTIALSGRLGDMADLLIAFTPPDSVGYFREISPPEARLLPVEGRHIGECLEKGLGWSFDQGYRKALAFNSDGPSLPLAVLQQAITSLDEAEVVIGPSQDGGYYLIGMKRLYGELFQGIRWSTDQVLNQTVAQAHALNLKTFFTQTWYDIDTADDLLYLQNEILSNRAIGLEYTRTLLNQLELLKRK